MKGMEVFHSHCAGLDVHKKTVTACCMTPGDGRGDFGDAHLHNDDARSPGAFRLAGRRRRHPRGHGEHRRVLEADLQYLGRALRGHLGELPAGEEHAWEETDVKDAAWLAELLRFGLVRGSFIPPLPQRDLRDLTRQRANLMQERATVTNQLQKVLEWANIKLAGVATSVTGASAQDMLEAILAGKGTPSCWRTWRRAGCGRSVESWRRLWKAGSGTTTAS